MKKQSAAKIILLVILAALLLFPIHFILTASHFKAILVPHHLIVKIDLNDLYSMHSSPNVKRVILLSPNHFNFGYNSIQTANKLQLDICIDTDFINNLTSQTKLFVENESFIREHGIFVHIPYIQTFFPNACLVPIITKSGTSKDQLDTLIAQIKDLLTQDNLNTILIASIDFNHYQSENYAKDSDRQIVEFLEGDFTYLSSIDLLNRLQNLEKSNDTINPDATNIDSPKTLYIFLSLVRDLDLGKFNFYKRTSSAEITNSTDPNQNTSHIFGWF